MGRERRRVRLRSVVEWWRCACLVGLGMMEVLYGRWDKWSFKMTDMQNTSFRKGRNKRILSRNQLIGRRNG
jgi:hypothetical protein